MEFPSEISLALKEWAAVCEALAGGRQVWILRKGGLAESAVLLQNPRPVLSESEFERGLS